MISDLLCEHFDEGTRGMIHPFIDPSIPDKVTNTDEAGSFPLLSASELRERTVDNPSVVEEDTNMM
jgi:hypothetical protein